MNRVFGGPLARMDHLRTLWQSHTGPRTPTRIGPHTHAHSCGHTDTHRQDAWRWQLSIATSSMCSHIWPVPGGQRLYSRFLVYKPTVRTLYTWSRKAKPWRRRSSGINKCLYTTHWRFSFSLLPLLTEFKVLEQLSPGRVRIWTRTFTTVIMRPSLIKKKKKKERAKHTKLFVSAHRISACKFLSSF